MQTPACGDNYISYTIAKGQTLYAIARQFNTTVAEILAANPALDVQLYYAGDVICIPKPDSGTSCANGTPYTIRQGDSFYLIAQRFGIPLANLLAANPGVDPARLVVGQVICVPVAPRGGLSQRIQRTYRHPGADLRGFAGALQRFLRRAAPCQSGR